MRCFYFLIFEKKREQVIGSSILLLTYQPIFTKLPISWMADLQNAQTPDALSG